MKCRRQDFDDAILKNAIEMFAKAALLEVGDDCCKRAAGRGGRFDTCEA
jgi:hypothetical protein